MQEAVEATTTPPRVADAPRSPAALPDVDGEVFAACTAFHAAFQTERDTIPETDEEGDALAATFYDTLKAVIATTPQTPAGLRAKAQAAYIALRDAECPRLEIPWREQPRSEQLLAIDTLAQMAGIDVDAPLPDADPDAELFELEHCLQASEAAADELQPYEKRGLDPRLTGILRGYWDAATRIAATPAQTIVGQQVKARTLRSVWTMTHGDEDGGHVGRQVASLIRDVLGEAE